MGLGGRLTAGATTEPLNGRDWKGPQSFPACAETPLSWSGLPKASPTLALLERGVLAQEGWVSVAL